MLTVEQVIRAYWNAYNAHDVEALLSLMSDDIIIGLPSSRKIAGMAKIRSALSVIFSLLIPDITEEVASTIITGRFVACEFVERGTVHLASACNDGGLGPERPYFLPAAAFFVIDGRGLIERIQFYWDTNRFGEQVGIDISGALHAQFVSVAEWLPRQGQLCVVAAPENHRQSETAGPSLVRLSA